MSSAPFIQIAWLLFTLIVAAANITSACLLLKDRGAGPVLMLTGSVITLIGAGLVHVWTFLQSLGVVGFSIRILEMLSPLGALGWLLFAIGLLLFALRRRSQTARIAELEAIVEAQRQRDSAH